MVIQETKLTLPLMAVKGEPRRRILAFTDLHFGRFLTAEKLQWILATFREAAERERVDYICFLGDLVDALDEVDDPAARKRLLDFLRELATLRPLIMVTGNHDWSRYEGHKALLCWEDFAGWAKELRAVPNLYLLEDAVFDDGHVRMLGVDLPAECYHFANATSRRPAAEAFREKMVPLLPQLETLDGVPRERYLLLHSSRFLREITLPEDVVVLSGHMHNGLVPPKMNKVLRHVERGLIGPGFNKTAHWRPHYELFPWNACLRPKPGRPWVSLEPCRYLPADRLVGKLGGGLFPEISYTIIAG